MSEFFSNTLSLPQWALLLAVPPAILILYFLKLKRQPLEVPSTFLWSRTIEDLHVNSIWQKLRQSLLLFLQLLLVALVVLACLRPGWQSSKLTGSRFIFLLDTSASMGATDVAPSRLGHAKRRAAELIDQMKYGEEATIMTFSDEARTSRSFTDNRRMLQALVREIEVTTHTTDISDALRVAAGQANTAQSGDPNNPQDQRVAEARPTTVYIFSDGGIGAVEDVTLGRLEVRYVAIGQSTPDNVAVTAFSVDRNPERADELQAFGRVENFGFEAREVSVSLYLDGQLQDAQKLNLEPQAGSGVQFQLRDVEQGQLKLLVDIQDDLEIDNQAFAAIDAPRPSRVLMVTRGNDSWRRALSTDVARRLADVVFVEPSYLESKAYLDESDLGQYDLIIYDQCQPPRMPQANTMFLGDLPPAGGWSREESTAPPSILDWERTHPLMQLLELGNVRIVEASAVKPPVGGLALMDSTAGTLIGLAERQAFQDVVIGFAFVGRDPAGDPIPNTDWPRFFSFPIFVQNVLQYLGNSGTATSAPSVRPGSPVRLRATGAVGTLKIVSPSGSESTLKREGQTGFTYTMTDELGVYSVYETNDRQPTSHFVVNLFHARESNLVPAEQLAIGSTEIKRETGTALARREMWKWILAAALVVLIFEWYVYNRRVYF
ncbi:MAG: VWA domain-containing protein [Planctomycetes bacterium]|nr:VWA domain-containing protein [Planctomycetota bacterium]